MKKIAWTSFLIFTLIHAIILNMGNHVQNPSFDNQNYPLDLSSSNSWSRIVKEGGNIYIPYCEINNGSLYVIGTLSSRDYSKTYLFVSKFTTSGDREWELSIRTKSFSQISYVFDNDNNLIILSQYPYSNNISLIKLNSSGTILFLREFNLGEYSLEGSLILGENNSLLILGQYYQYPYPEFYIIKFNNAGQYLWNVSLYTGDYYFPLPIVKDSDYNIYLYFRNNSLQHLAQINGSGLIIWQITLENEVEQLIVDSNDNLFIIGAKNSTTGYILKINSTGNQIKELQIENYKEYYVKIWYLDDLLAFDRYSMQVLCFNLNLDLKWNISLFDYLTKSWILQTYIAKDSQGNVYIMQNNELEDINLVKISSVGEFLSIINWGGIFPEIPASLNIDLDDNVYFVCTCYYKKSWGDSFEYAILVKNPVNGGTPPEPRIELDIRDYFLFSVLGISFIISLIALLSILRNKKKRIG